MDRFLIESLRMANGLIALGIVLAFGLAALVIPMPIALPAPLVIALGAALGLAVAVLLCGSAATLLSIHDQLAASGAAHPARSPAQHAAIASAVAAASVANGKDASALSGSARIEAGSQAVAVDPNTGMPVSTNLSNLPEYIVDLLNTGRFGEYHLEKAKIAFANRDLKQARYDISAAMAHDPGNSAIRELRAQIRSAR